MPRDGLARRPRILYLDAHDSFANNLIAQVEKVTDAEVVKCSIDAEFTEGGDAVTPTSASPPDADLASNPNQNQKVSRFQRYLHNFDAVIAGPGPGWATRDADVKLIKELWTLENDALVPILGISLGFQSLCLAFGAGIEHLKEPRHGLGTEILHNRHSIFDSVDTLNATLYHSLQVVIGHRMQTHKAVSYPGQLWEPSEKCPLLKPLAWDFENRENGAVLMAARHIEKPFWGVQFHPESVCTNGEGTRIIKNWWREVQSFQRGSKSADYDDIRVAKTSGDCGDEKYDFTPRELASLIVDGDGISMPAQPPTTVHCATTGSGRLTVADIVENLGVQHTEAIVLESGLQPDLIPSASGAGRYSIIGLIIPSETLRLHYYASTCTMQLRNGSDQVIRSWKTPSAWTWIKEFMTHLHGTLRTHPTTPTWAPFWGGLMGYSTCRSENLNMDARELKNPDMCFAYITRSIVVDHQLKKIYVQSIRGYDDNIWVRSIWSQLYEAVGRKSLESTPSGTPMPQPNPFETNSILGTYISGCRRAVVPQEEYLASVAACQGYIKDAQSYNLTLTTHNFIRAPKPLELSNAEKNALSWSLYKQLSTNSSAPFSAYLRLHDVHILNPSPERHIAWDRSQRAQSRPIKGTVLKEPGVVAADAHDILLAEGQRGEHCSVVDAVRGSLQGVYGAGNVHVTSLMEVEEDETEWNLVSIIDATPTGMQKHMAEGDATWEEPTPYLSTSSQQTQPEPYLPLLILTSSLPPPSTTGTPSKRSCSTLQKIQNTVPWTMSSGILGYLDIGGAGDFSVIRGAAIKTDSLSSPPSPSNLDQDTHDIWHMPTLSSPLPSPSPYKTMLSHFNMTALAFSPYPNPNASAKTVETLAEDGWAKLVGGLRGMQMQVGDAGRGEEPRNGTGAVGEMAGLSLGELRGWLGVDEDGDDEE